MYPERIKFQNEIVNTLPEIRLGLWQAKIKIQPSGPDIIQWIEKVLSDFSTTYRVEDISAIPVIADTKDAYRKLGKDPSRYRPSAEALCRRIAGGKSLFRVNNAVDILNAISISSGYSIGGYDCEKITGDVVLGIGKDMEPYQAIGRGDLNICNLPVLRDDLGPFGSPTSDSVRTMVTDSTTRFLMIFFDFSGKGDLGKALESTSMHYRNLADAEDIRIAIQNV
ncbi:MAG TPA: phenylalanine--tRNA ligase beta subunit-related protein [Cyclobacteriaceae bacterium]|nr:phenylalanine--tRNA ligase beta subunit-related protein [Cyclobacteriaceae bacterium]